MLVASIFYYLLPISFSDVTVNNILLYRTCLHASNYTKEECNGFLLPDKTNATNRLEEDVQKHVTQILMVITIIRTIVPVILSLFVSEWSDLHGRKPLIVWPLFGKRIF